MASTAHKTDDEIREYHDTPEELEAKVEQLARLIQESRKFIVWTGAGISTSTGVPDFRGPNGKWTLEAQGRQRDPTIRVVSTLAAHPSRTHMALVQLNAAGRLKHLISSNTDGLHRRSGFPGEHLSELHGNSNKVRCDTCHRWAFMDNRCRWATGSHNHETGQACVYGQCPGMMHDTIINFGEYLHDEICTRANDEGANADLVLVLGSSLRVITCNALEDIQRKRRGALVVVNLQTTPYDKACKVRIFANCDEVMELLMPKLGLTIPTWTLSRFVRFERNAAAMPTELIVRGTEETGTMNYNFAKQIAVFAADGTLIGKASPDKAALFRPLQVALRRPLAEGEQVTVKFAFQGHNDEPVCEVPLVIVTGQDSASFRLDMDVDGTKLWTVRSTTPQQVGAAALPPSAAGADTSSID
jgi:NAD-dependent SIR2 family protein deacetylase